MISGSPLIIERSLVYSAALVSAEELLAVVSVLLEVDDVSSFLVSLDGAVFPP